MPDLPSPTTTAELLAQREWLRRLARTLVRDSATAEDLVQQAVLTAVLSPPSEAGALRGWLARVTRNLSHLRARGDRRRQQREESAARPESLPPASVLLERVEIQRVVAEEVLQLAEPYRSTLLLRFWEDASASEIAEAQGVSAGTVRSRLKRGLEVLRTRLDAQSGGDRTVWLEALAPLALPLPAAKAAAGTTSLLTGGSLLMKKLVVGAVVVALGLVVLWRARTIGPPPIPDSGVTVEEVVLRPLDVAHADSPATPEETDPSKIPSAPSRAVVETEPGSILGHLTWEIDGAPAVGVAVSLRPPVGSPTPRILQTFPTDADGGFAIPDLVPGAYELRCDRAPGAMEVLVEPGAEHVIDYALSSAVDYCVRVEDDHGRPVPGATIWHSPLTTWGSGYVVGQTGTDGTARVRVSGSALVLSGFAARKEGLQPSSLQECMRPNPRGTADFVLVLSDNGGSLAGQILDLGGRPLAGATVAATSRIDTCGCRPRVGTLEPLPLWTKTDTDGRYRLEGLCTGWLQVAAYAPGFANAMRDVLIRPGEPTVLDMELDRGATVRGCVRDALGEPIAGASLWISEHGGLIPTPQAVTAADGTYCLTDITPGSVAISANPAPPPGQVHRITTKTTLDVGPGGDVEWNPVVRTGMTIEGRLVDTAGHALAGWQVSTLPRLTQEPQTTGADGGFRFPCGEDRGYRLTAQPPRGEQADAGWQHDIASPPEVFPDEEDVVVVVESVRTPVVSAFVSGILVDQSGISLTDEVRCAGRSAHPDPTSGRFQFGPLPAGSWTLEWVTHRRGEGPNEGWFRSPLHTFEIAEGEYLDLGLIPAPSQGSLSAHIEPPEGMRLRSMQVEIRRRGDPEEIRGGARLGDQRDFTYHLPAGPYVLACRATGVAEQLIPFVIAAEEETALTIQLCRGTPVRLRPPDFGGEHIELAVRDDAGSLVLLDRIDTGTFFCDRTLALSLAPGRYAVKARTDAGQSGGITFEVFADRAPAGIIEIPRSGAAGGR